MRLRDTDVGGIMLITGWVGICVIYRFVPALIVLMVYGAVLILRGDR